MVFQHCPQAAGKTLDKTVAEQGNEGLRMKEGRDRSKKPNLVAAPYLKGAFLEVHKKICDTKEDLFDVNTNTAGSKALLHQGRWVTPGGKKKKSWCAIQDDPLELRVDATPCPPITTKSYEHKVFFDKYDATQGTWSAKLVKELNHCEWAQHTAVKIMSGLLSQDTRQCLPPHVERELAALSSTLDLMGNNLSRAEE